MYPLPEGLEDLYMFDSHRFSSEKSFIFMNPIKVNRQLELFLSIGLISMEISILLFFSSITARRYLSFTRNHSTKIENIILDLSRLKRSPSYISGILGQITFGDYARDLEKLAALTIKENVEDIINKASYSAINFVSKYGFKLASLAAKAMIDGSDIMDTYAESFGDQAGLTAKEIQEKFITEVQQRIDEVTKNGIITFSPSKYFISETLEMLSVVFMSIGCASFYGYNTLNYFVTSLSSFQKIALIDRFGKDSILLFKNHGANFYELNSIELTYIIGNYGEDVIPVLQEIGVNINELNIKNNSSIDICSPIESYTGESMCYIGVYTDMK